MLTYLNVRQYGFLLHGFHVEALMLLFILLLLNDVFWVLLLLLLLHVASHSGCGRPDRFA